MVWTESQFQRLKDLKAGYEVLEREFIDAGDRNREFLELEKKLVREQRSVLQNFQDSREPPALCTLEETLSAALLQHGFSRITTPTIMSKGLLVKMSITEDHPLFSQVFWIDSDRCMRPMLAPHLYYVLVDLLRLWKHPVRIFEIGMCYRKETKGARHAGEFTMCNLVEMGIDPDEREDRFDKLAALITEAAGIRDYRLDIEKSAVYGDTVDVIGGPNNLELGSGAFGPHPLDKLWKIDVPWVGIGFGLERLIMASKKSENITPWKRSLSFLNGIRLNV